VCDQDGRPINLHLTEGQVSDYDGARVLVDKLPKAQTLLADRGYDADWFREVLIKMGITPCIPPKKNRIIQYFYDKNLYKKRHKIENMFGWLKDWRRIAMRFDRCAHTFKTAITIAAIVLFWI
jgi:putative transposase